MNAETHHLFRALGFSLLAGISVSATAVTITARDGIIQRPENRVLPELETGAGNIRIEAGGITRRPDHQRVHYSHSGSSISDYMPGGRYGDSNIDTPRPSGKVVFEDVSTFSNRTFFTSSFQIDIEGTYQAVLTDFEFPRALKMAGINITTATESLGMLTAPGYFTFDAGPGDYYLSFFGKARQLGQYGIEVSMLSSAVPLPAAAWLFGSGLLGLAGVVCRVNRKNSWSPYC